MKTFLASVMILKQDFLAPELCSQVGDKWDLNRGLYAFFPLA